LGNVHTFVNMSTESWTMDGLNVGRFSCYFWLQITNLGVYICKYILCSCVMILHTPHKYFRLQPVLSANLCSVGFANVDVFLSKCVLQNGHKLHVCAAMNTKIGAN